MGLVKLDLQGVLVWVDYTLVVCKIVWDALGHSTTCQSLLNLPKSKLQVLTLAFYAYKCCYIFPLKAILGLWISAFQLWKFRKESSRLPMYASRLLNLAKRNYTTIERETLVMVYALHKFKHHLLGNQFVFYVNHMALVYLVNKPKVFGKIVRWLLLLLEYDFKIVYKLGRSHLMAYVFSRLPNQA
jgi:hypothetical protein